MSFSFSYNQEIYHELLEGLRRYLQWKNEEKTWNYPKCDVSVIGMKDNQALIVLRRTKAGYSSFMKSEFSVNLMMGFVTKSFSEPKKLDDKWIIEFQVEKNNDKDLREIKDVKIGSENQDDIQALHEEIKEKMGKESDNIFDINTTKNKKIIPVIYQPNIDTWKNFLREIHVNEMQDKYEVTLVFNDERLRKNFLFDFFYRLFRLARYKRTKDIESFFIDSTKTHFSFPYIYSGNNTIYHDSVHDDNPEHGVVPDRKVKYYFQDKNHPIVFVNTSNHAMAPHDNNHDFWKWEYIPWSEKIPIKYDTKSKSEVEDEHVQF